jgi:hypothetical protein
MPPLANFGFVYYQTIPTKLITDAGWVLRTRQGAGDELYGLLAKNISRGALGCTPLLRGRNLERPHL